MYRYEDEKEKLFTEQGTDMYIEVRDKVLSLLKSAGAFRLENAITGQTGDSWTMIACVDRLVEKNVIREIKQDNPAGQYRIFVKA